MITTLSTKGQAVIPESIREQARLKAGDKLDVGYINGLVVLRKRVPLTPAQARALILSGRELPAQTAEDQPRSRKLWPPFASADRPRESGLRHERGRQRELLARQALRLPGRLGSGPLPGLRQPATPGRSYGDTIEELAARYPGRQRVAWVSPSPPRLTWFFQRNGPEAQPLILTMKCFWSARWLRKRSSSSPGISAICSHCGSSGEQELSRAPHS